MKKYITLLAISFFACTLTAFTAEAPRVEEKVPETIKTPTIWKTGSTYYIQNSVTVEATLTIQEGAVVKFARDKGISTSKNGLIACKGTASSPVIFTAASDNTAGITIKNVESAERGYWGGVYISDTNNSSFVWCEFRYAGYSAENLDSGLNYGVLYTGAKNIKIENCTFRHCNGYGIQAAYEALPVMIKSCIFEDVQRPMIISPAMSIDLSNTFKSADQNAIWVSPNSFGFNQEETKGLSVIWEENRVPFVIAESIQSYQGNILTLKDSVTLKFEAGVCLTFSGDNKANANDSLRLAKSVRLTSIRDDQNPKNSDTNADQDASTPDTNDWDGIYNGKDGNYVRCEGIILYDSHNEDGDAVAYRFE